MALAVEELAKEQQGKQALAIQAFANALKQIPTIIADNGGFDSSEIIQNILYNLRHGKTNSGIDMING